MAKPQILLYVDVVSPFGYYAFHILRNSPIFRGVDIVFVPMLLGGVMQATNNRPPIGIQNKNLYVEASRKRWVREFGIPVADTVPTPFPQSTVTAQRALCAIELAGGPDAQADLVKAVDAMSRAFWLERKTISEPETVRAALVQAFGEEKAAKVMGQVKNEEVKEQLKKNTQKALEDGCFGLPWMVCTNAKGEKEGFWGVDHLGLLSDFLGLKRDGVQGLKSLL